MFPMRATRESTPNHRAGTSLCSDLIVISSTLLRPQKRTDGSGSNQRRSSISSQNRTARGPTPALCHAPTAGTFIQPDHLGVHETLWHAMTSWARFLNPTEMHSVSSNPTTVGSDTQMLGIFPIILIDRLIPRRRTEFYTPRPGDLRGSHISRGIEENQSRITGRGPLSVPVSSSSRRRCCAFRNARTDPGRFSVDHRSLRSAGEPETPCLRYAMLL